MKNLQSRIERLKQKINEEILYTTTNIDDSAEDKNSYMCGSYEGYLQALKDILEYLRDLEDEK